MHLVELYIQMLKKEDKEENERMIDFALKATGIEEIQDKK